MGKTLAKRLDDYFKSGHNYGETITVLSVLAAVGAMTNEDGDKFHNYIAETGTSYNAENNTFNPDKAKETINFLIAERLKKQIEMGKIFTEYEEQLNQESIKNGIDIDKEMIIINEKKEEKKTTQRAINRQKAYQLTNLTDETLMEKSLALTYNAFDRSEFLEKIKVKYHVDMVKYAQEENKRQLALFDEEKKKYLEFYKGVQDASSSKCKSHPEYEMDCYKIDEVNNYNTLKKISKIAKDLNHDLQLIPKNDKGETLLSNAICASYVTPLIIYKKVEDANRFKDVLYGISRFNKMLENDFSHTFHHNSESYRNMKEALQKASDLMITTPLDKEGKPLKKNNSMINTIMKNVVYTTACYIEAHKQEQNSKDGKGRFAIAAAVLSMVDPSAAAVMQDEVRELRKDKTLDFNNLHDKVKIPAANPYDGSVFARDVIKGTMADKPTDKENIVGRVKTNIEEISMEVGKGNNRTTTLKLKEEKDLGFIVVENTSLDSQSKNL